MAVRFVKTEILSSNDGLSHGESKTLETEEVLAAKRGGSGKTLFEQLEEHKARQQEAYDANTRLIFAPPQSLDNEDVAFFEAEATRRREAARERDRNELNAFAVERSHYNAERAPEAKPVVRRKPETTDAPAIKLRRKRPGDDAPTKAPAPAPAPGPTSLNSLLACYNDDEDEGDDDDDD